MSFIREEDIMNLIENLMCNVFKKFRNINVPLPIKRMTYKDAMENYGSDKPGIYLK
jgi:aspartyl-tRNA synthetase